MRRAIALAALLGLAAPGLAQAEPAKVQAQSLVTEGVALLRAKRYPAALAKFQLAYERYPSPKILLNIGTTLKEMGRLAEAANVYHEYIGDPSTTPERRLEVKRILGELDAKLVILTVEVSPASVEVSIDGRPWQPISRALVTRVSPGARLVRARGNGFEPGEASVNGGPGEARKVVLTLQPVRVVAPTPAVAVRPEPGQSDDEVGAGAVVRAEAPRYRANHRFGVGVEARVDGKLRGAATAVGVFYEPVPAVQIEAAGLMSEVYGAYGGLRVRLMPTAFRPHVAVGVPIFFSDGTRVAGRAALGAELELGDHFLLLAEAGYEHFFNPEMGYQANLFVPVVGIQGRM